MELGAGEIIVILVVVLLLFGPSKLPRLGEGLGSALANFRKAVRGDDSAPRAASTVVSGQAAPPASQQVSPRADEPRKDGVCSGAS